MNYDYSKICNELTQNLAQREKEILWRRFGLAGGERETLQKIGDDFGLSRERVRQIQDTALSKIKPKINQYKEILEDFVSHLRSFGGLKKEDSLLSFFGGEGFQNHVVFILNLGDLFSRFQENDHYHSFWAVEPNSFNFAQKIINSFHRLLEKKKEPLNLENLSFRDVVGKNLDQPLNYLSLQALESFLEISKKIQRNNDGYFGLNHWPEISPKGIKDQAYLVFKKEKKPLHFAQVAKLIGKNCNVQSCHNELIRDQRFILVGRGIYALREWGYTPGFVKDVILEILKDAKRPLSKEEIFKKVLEKRLVKKNTILLNLNNKKLFTKTNNGKYTLAQKRV